MINRISVHESACAAEAETERIWMSSARSALVSDNAGSLRWQIDRCRLGCRKIHRFSYNDGRHHSGSGVRSAPNAINTGRGERDRLGLVEAQPDLVGPVGQHALDALGIVALRRRYEGNRVTRFDAHDIGRVHERVGATLVEHLDVSSSGESRASAKHGGDAEKREWNQITHSYQILFAWF
jgi:hypothetical protein